MHILPTSYGLIRPEPINAVQFDGTSDALFTSGFTSQTTTTQNTTAFFIRFPTRSVKASVRPIFQLGLWTDDLDGQQFGYLIAGAIQSTATDAPISLLCYGQRNFGGFVDLTLSRGTGYILARDTWYSVYISHNLLTDTSDCYINGASVSFTGFANIWDGIFQTNATSYVASATGYGTGFFDMSHFWCNTTTYFPGATYAAAFRTSTGKPKPLGTNGSLPTGTQPHIYLNNPGNDFRRNKGSFGDYTVIGSLLDTDIP